MMAFRFLPNPPDIIFANSSLDPALNSSGGASLMPNPPAVTGVPKGAVSIAMGFLSNTLLFPSPSLAGKGTFDFSGVTGVSGGKPGIGGQGIGLVASYVQVGTSGTTVNPDPFLTGTSAHNRSYTIEVRRSGAANVSIVGTSATSSYFDPNILPDGDFVFPTTLDIPRDSSGNLPNAGDLLIYLSANDQPAAPNIPNDDSGNPPTFTTPTGFSGNSSGFSFDSPPGGMGYRISYATYDGSALEIDSLTGGDTNVPTAHMLIALRGATLAYSNPPNSAVFDNNSTNLPGPPDPPSLGSLQAGSLVIAVGMIDNIAISNVTTITPPDGYTQVAAQSYGIQNNGAIVMTSFKNDLPGGSEDPGAYIGGGGNVWAAQTLIIGGPGSSTSGTSDRAGLYGGGGGSASDDATDTGVSGAQGGARIMWGSGRQYPSSNQGNTPFPIDWTP